MYFSVYAHGTKQHYGNDFVAEFRTTSSPETITIPFVNAGTYNCTIDWGDGTANSAITTYNDADRAHEFATAGTHVIKIRGTMRGIGFNNTGDKLKIYDVKQWGHVNQTSWNTGFYGCTNLQVTATDDACNDGTVTTLAAMFRACTNFNSPLINWNTSAVTSISLMFRETAFNQNIGNWNTANVTSMTYLFWSAIAFNQPIGNWNTVKVTSMLETFWGASAFNQPIGNWNTAAVTNVDSMFQGASAFNQPIGSWDVSKVAYFIEMFRDATSFNQNLENWNMAKAADMNNMWLNATAMNQANVDNFLKALYTQRMNFTWTTPTVSLASCAAPSGTYADEDPPTTGNGYRYELVNDPEGEGHVLWTITVRA